MLIHEIDNFRNSNICFIKRYWLNESKFLSDISLKAVVNCIYVESTSLDKITCHKVKSLSDMFDFLGECGPATSTGMLRDVDIILFWSVKYNEH